MDELWFDGANGEGPNGKKQVYDFERWYAGYASAGRVLQFPGAA